MSDVDARSHVAGPSGWLCGNNKHGRRSPAFMEPSCAKCAALRAGAWRMFVAMAEHLAAKYGRPVSAGEVAFHTAGAGRGANEVLLEVETALERAGMKRASWVGGGRWADVTLWSAASREEG
jgi:hypothetical protein